LDISKVLLPLYIALLDNELWIQLIFITTLMKKIVLYDMFNINKAKWRQTEQKSNTGSKKNKQARPTTMDRPDKQKHLFQMHILIYCTLSFIKIKEYCYIPFIILVIYNSYWNIYFCRPFSFYRWELQPVYPLIYPWALPYIKKRKKMTPESAL